MKNLKQILSTNKVEPCNITKVLNIDSPSYLLYNIVTDKTVDEIIDLLVWCECTNIPLRTLIKKDYLIRNYINKKNKEIEMENNSNSNKGLETIQQLRENKEISKLLAVIEQQNKTIEQQSNIIAKQVDIIAALTNK